MKVQTLLATLCVTTLSVTASLWLTGCSTPAFEGEAPELVRESLAASASSGKPVLFDLYADW